MHIKQHANIVRAILYNAPFVRVQVTVDNLTDNLIVHDTRRGFVITHHCLEEWKTDRLAKDVKQAATDLVEGREGAITAILPIVELERQRHATCSFDEKTVHPGG